MNESFFVKIILYFFFYFSIIALPAVFIYYFVNLWLNKRDPEREAKQYNQPLSTFRKYLGTISGVGMIILGPILLIWPLRYIIVEGGKILKNLNLPDDLFLIIVKLPAAFLFPSMLIFLGLFYLKTVITGKQEKLTGDDFSLRILSRNIILYCKLAWHHLVFWCFPALEEAHHTNLGLVYFQLEHFRKAIAAFKKSEESHNQHDASYSKFNWYYLGYCYLNLGDFREAIKFFEQYLRLDRDNHEVLSITSWAYGLLNEPESALINYKRLLDIEPSQLEVHLNCSKILLDLNRQEEALQQLEKAKIYVKNQLDHEVVQSQLYMVEKNLTEAITVLEVAVERIETEEDLQTAFAIEDLLLMLSKVQKKNGDHEGALSTLEEILNRNLGDIWFLNEVAMEYADQSINLKDALNIIDEALYYQPDNSIFLDTKGWILYKMGRIEGAKDNINRCLTLNPKYKEAKEHFQAVLTG